MSVITRVNIKINIEKILSYIKLHNTLSQLHAKHFGLKSNSVITEEIQTIHRMLNISDPITFHTHMSYFFYVYFNTHSHSNINIYENMMEIIQIRMIISISFCMFKNGF